MKIFTMNNFAVCLLLLISISGCSFLGVSNGQESSLSDSLDQVEVDFSVEEIQAIKYPIGLVNNNQLLIADTLTQNVNIVYLMNGDEIPPLFRLFDIKISPSKEYIVWYSPQKGLLALKLGESMPEVIRQPNQWLSNNPYFEFGLDQDILYFVDDEGLGFYSISLDTNSITSIDIPFPFGNAFKISPDRSKILFIAGFGQNDQDPEYMITNLDGTQPVRFTTTTPLNLRQKVAWLPNSSGVIMLGADNEVLLYSLESAAVSTFYEHPVEDTTLTEMSRVDDLLYYATSDGWWHAFNVDTLEEVARVPKQIAEDVHRPRFIPWHENSFLIEETLRLDPEQFKRLWHSSFIGVKKQVVEMYDERTITTDTPEI